METKKSKMIIMKKVVYSVIVIALLSGCRQSTDQSTTSEKKIVSVTTAKVQSSQNANCLHYSGTIEASQTIPLTFQSTGIVEKIYVEAGDVVKKGQLLATVDKSDMLSLYNTMLAKYQQAKDAYDRLKSVHDQGSLPEIKWVEMVTNMEQANSSLEMAKNNLDKCNLRAPEDGIIGQRNVEPGQSALGSLAPLQLVKIETVLVKVSVPENEINKIKKGFKANIKISALNEKQFDGLVTNVSPVAEFISRTYNVKITIRNVNLELKPGMVCDVTLNLESGNGNGIVVIPYNAINKDNDGKPFVFVVSADNKSVKKKNITTGNYHESGIEVLSGLMIGETIVVEGKEKLSDNSLIDL
jgi:RND family efflux transporter MFP subunit